VVLLNSNSVDLLWWCSTVTQSICCSDVQRWRNMCVGVTRFTDFINLLLLLWNLIQLTESTLCAIIYILLTLRMSTFLWSYHRSGWYSWVVTQPSTSQCMFIVCMFMSILIADMQYFVLVKLSNSLSCLNLCCFESHHLPIIYLQHAGGNIMIQLSLGVWFIYD